MGVVIIEFRTAYGHVRAYAVNDTAKALLRLIGAKTFSDWHLQEIERLGYTIETHNRAWPNKGDSK